MGCQCLRGGMFFRNIKDGGIPYPPTSHPTSSTDVSIVQMYSIKSCKHKTEKLKEKLEKLMQSGAQKPIKIGSKKFERSNFSGPKSFYAKIKMVQHLFIRALVITFIRRQLNLQIFGIFEIKSARKFKVKGKKFELRR